MPKVKTQQIRDLSEGIIQRVDERILVENCVYLAQNLRFDNVLGRAVLREGTTQLGAQIVDGASCLGLFQHIESDGTKIPLAVFDDHGTTPANSDIYKYTSDTWSKSEEDWTKSTKVRFVTFLDVSTAVNGTDSPATFNGTNWADTTIHDTGNFPNGKYVIEFLDRIYVAGVSGNLDRLYYSSIPVTGNISWTDGNGNLDIEPEEGTGAITGLAKVPGYILIFKERSLKRWDAYSTYPESLIDIGCPSQEGIVSARQSIYFFNKKGIYQTTGKYPQKISRRIQDIIEAIPSSYYSSVSGWSDGDNIFFSIGDVTLDSIVFSNAVIVYNIDSQSWTLFTFPNEFLAWTKYVDSDGDEFVLAGDDDGQVWEVLEGTGDAGAEIPWFVQWNQREFSRRGYTKDITTVVPYTEDIRTGNIFCRINGTDRFEMVGTIDNKIKRISTSLHGNYFEFRMNGRGLTGTIIGIDFPGINVNEIYENGHN